MVTEKVLAFTRLYRRLITAKQIEPNADTKAAQKLILKYFPSWKEIYFSHGTEKLWLFVAKTLGCNLFLRLFLSYLK